MYTRKTLVKTKDQRWGGYLNFFNIFQIRFLRNLEIKEPLAPVLKKFWKQRWVLFFWKFENPRMSGFDLVNNFRTSRSSFSKKPQRTEGFHKIISSYIEGYPTNSEIFWELCLYMRISSQILRTIVVYQKLVIWIFANHGHIPGTPPENRQLSFSISDSHPTLVKTCFHWDLFQESLKFHLNLWLTTD
jgi:hypothetical protein